MIKIKADAKINLALEVMEKECGYHRVNNLMIPIDLYDEITLEKDDKIIILNDPFPGENIMEKAAKLFFLKTKIDGGVFITI
jgi:4-diphosphocytidyl-2C-methyl-D-erythritol kinase